MEVDKARAFLVLAEELNFGRAAERLKIAQPPLSRMIQKLERSLQVQLFDRSTRRVELTEAGLALIEPARALVTAAETAVEAARHAAEGTTGLVDLGFAGASNVHHAVSLTREVASRYPAITVTLHSAQFSHIGLERVIDGTLDVSIGRYSFLPADIAKITLADEEVVVAVPSDHPLAHRDVVSVSELTDQHWVVLPGGFGNALSNAFTMMTNTSGLDISHQTVAPDSWTQVFLVGAGIGVALTVDSVAAKINDPNVRFLRLNHPSRFLQPQIIWRADNTNPALHKLLDAVPFASGSGS